jgi:3-oxoacyl-[acyl-carrier protein] reductase
MDLQLADKAAVVTGASRGIGCAIARALAGQGCDVVLAARSGPALEALAAEIGRATNRRAVVHAADLRLPESAGALVRRAVEALGRIDILVNSAGATKRGDFFQLADADFEDGFLLKFHGAVRLARAAWPHLKASRGAIVNVIGVGGKNASADFTIGGSVNAALMNFTKALAQIGTRDGVAVNAISPGPILTDRLKTRIGNAARERKVGEDEAAAAVMREMGVARFGRPEEVADLACYLASRRARFLQGAIVDIDGGVTKAI